MTDPDGLAMAHVATVAVIRRLRRLGDRFIAREAEALVWDPTAVRLVMDERPGPQPLVVTLVPGEAPQGEG